MGAFAPVPTSVVVPIQLRCLAAFTAAPRSLAQCSSYIIPVPPTPAALVDCVAQLGGLHEAQAALRRRMPRQLAALISRALDSFPASQRLPPSQYAQEQQRSGGAAGAAGPGDDISVPPAVAGVAQALLEHVLGTCLQVHG